MINDDLVYSIVPTTSLDEVFLTPLYEKSCREFIEEQKYRNALLSNNINPINQILLTGLPGNGKTLLAEAIAYELSMPVFIVRYENIICDSYKETMMKLYELVALTHKQRCVLLFDNFDIIAEKWGHILLKMNKFPIYTVVIVAITNSLWPIKHGVLTRFQLRLSLPSPSLKQIEQYLAVLETRLETSMVYPLRISLEYPLTSLAKKLYGCCYSDIEQFCLNIQRKYFLWKNYKGEQNIDFNSVKDIVNRCLKQIERA
jgi:SpoVK/Ycf46/Vps4 family AAA+-type ATPase